MILFHNIITVAFMLSKQRKMDILSRYKYSKIANKKFRFKLNWGYIRNIDIICFGRARNNKRGSTMGAHNRYQRLLKTQKDLFEHYETGLVKCYW